MNGVAFNAVDKTDQFRKTNDVNSNCTKTQTNKTKDNSNGNDAIQIKTNYALEEPPPNAHALHSDNITDNKLNPNLIRRSFNAMHDLNTLHSYLTFNPKITNNASHILSHPKIPIRNQSIGNVPNLKCTEYFADESNDNDQSQYLQMLIALSATKQKNTTLSLLEPEMPIFQKFHSDTHGMKPNETNTNSNKKSLSPPSTTANSTNTIQSIISLISESPTLSIQKSDQSLPETVPTNHNSEQSSLQYRLLSIMGKYDEAYAKNQTYQSQTTNSNTHTHIKNGIQNVESESTDNQNKSAKYCCQFTECNRQTFKTDKLFAEHNNKYHDVGLELRFIVLAAGALTKPFPEIGLQCPYINCDDSVYFQCVDDVIHHLQSEHDEDLRDIAQTPEAKAQNILTSSEAAKYMMVLGKVPCVFDDNVIYCCPFNKNEICPTKCFVENANGLIQHLTSFHALNSEDAQFIINVLRFIELKPVWRYWSEQTRTERIHKRLDAILKYRGNVRKGFVKQYKNQYKRRFFKNKKVNQTNVRKCSKNEYNGIIESTDVSIMTDDTDLFWSYKSSDNVGIDEGIFETIVSKALVKKYGYEKSESERIQNSTQKRFRTDAKQNHYTSNLASQSKRRRYNDHY